MDARRRRSPLITLGLAVAILALAGILALLVMDMLSETPSPYLGMLAFLLLPAILAAGLAVAALGALLTFRAWRREGGDFRARELWPRLDLNDPAQRGSLAGAAVAVALALPFLGVMTYEGYHYTDSNEFCGLLCHTVMEPHYTAYQASPHARVSCVDCHIGTGATWYVKSKLSGARQVFAVAFDNFERPIPPATHELRPAKETCQDCHWPSKFFGDQFLVRQHSSSDEASTPRAVRLLVKTGGADPALGPPSGIHWHMALGNTIEYVATDPALQEIPWVKITDLQSGTSKIFRSDGRSADDPLPPGFERTLDCMDCHNRATHIFLSPQRAADRAFAVDPTLRQVPFAKRTLVDALSREDATKEEGRRRVREDIERFYESNHSDVARQEAATIEKLVSVGERIYDTYIFPEMRASWRTYKENIGHLEAPGCFRCHDGKHVDRAGNTITRDCRVCHEFMTESTLDDGTRALAIGSFSHSFALEGPHAAARCDSCHTGGPMPEPTCTGCHSLQAGFIEGELPGLALMKELGIEADIMAGMVECTDCHQLDADDPIAAITASCVTCHEDEMYGEMLASWRDDVEAGLAALPGDLPAEKRELLRTLRRAGVLHNYDATLKILEAIEK